MHDLHFYYEGAPQTRDETRKLTLANIEELGARLLAENKGYRDRHLSALRLGAMTTVVTHEEIADILSGDSRFKDKYLLAFPDDLYSLIDWDGQDHVVRKVILQKSDLVFSPNRKTIQWCLGRPPYAEGEDAFVKEFKTLKPCVHGSDAHELDGIGRACARRGDPTHRCAERPGECDLKFCWVKADPTFEGLRQLLYEPADRVCIQTEDPSPLKSTTSLDMVHVAACTVNADLAMAELNLPLNQGLVAVTGGKGSGKTALVDLIANCYQDRRHSGDPNSFVGRILDDQPRMSVQLRFGDGHTFQKGVAEDDLVEDAEVTYIAQGELERYVGSGSDLDQYINKLIFDSPNIKNTVKAFEYETAQSEVNDIGSRLRSSHEHIEALESSTADKLIQTLSQEQKQLGNELEDVRARIAEVESRISKEKLEVTQKKQSQISVLSQRKEELLRLKARLSEAYKLVTDVVPAFASWAAEINALCGELGFPETVSALEYPDTDKLLQLLREVDRQLATTVGEIEALEKKVRGFESGMRSHSEMLGRQREVEARLAALKTKLAAVEVSRAALAAARKERQALFASFIKAFVREKEEYAEIIGLFAAEKAPVLSDLDFVANLRFANTALLAALGDVVDNRQIEVHGRPGSPSEFKNLVELYEAVASGKAAAADDVAEETERLSRFLVSKLKPSRAVTPRALYEALYGSYIDVVPSVTYKGTLLNRLSLGQKATVLIKIYLAQGTCPIIIDSHDDHLDNEFIMDELVGAFRHAKTYRQVILASNNGNVVINSDAEQLVIANRDEGRISYIAGSIENPAIRDRALKVLEGGEAAFRKRQLKYRIGR